MSVSASVSRPTNRIFSVKDQAAHTKLKFRQYGQANSEEMTSKNLKDNLLIKEQNLLTSNNSKNKVNNDTHSMKPTLQLLKNESENIDIDEIRKKYDDEDVNNSDDESFDSRYLSYLYICYISVY